jgi:hypothetical protein
MKKYLNIIMATLILFSFIARPVSAQEEKDFRYTLKTNPVSAALGPLWVAMVVPLTGEYKLQFEARTFDKQSAQISIGYLGPNLAFNPSSYTKGDTSINVSGIHAQLFYKFFVTSQKAPNGFYLAPAISYATAKWKNSEDPNDYLSASKLRISALFGYQLITKGGFALDAYTGLGVKKRDYKLAQDNSVIDIEDLGDWLNKKNFAGNVCFGLSFGYAF